MLFLSGQTSSGTSIPDIAGQTWEVLRRVDELLSEAGTEKSRLLSVTIYLRDARDFAAMNAVWERWLPENAAPVRATVEVRLASAELLVEVSVIAAAGPFPGGTGRSTLQPGAEAVRSAKGFTREMSMRAPESAELNEAGIIAKATTGAIGASSGHEGDLT